MGSLNRDTIIASFMLIFWSIFLWASFDIRIVEYGTMEADVWPRGILVVLYVLTAIYLVQSLRAGPDAAPDEPFTVGGWLRKYRNPIWCFALYLLFPFNARFLWHVVRWNFAGLHAVKYFGQSLAQRHRNSCGGRHHFNWWYVVGFHIWFECDLTAQRLF